MEELTIQKTKKCIIFYDKSEIWVDEEVASNIVKCIGTDTAFEINGGLFRGNQIEGIRAEEQMKEIKLKKNGYWKCDYGTWHSKNETCSCSMSLKNRVIKKDNVNTNKGRRLTGLEKWGKTKLPENIINKYKNLTN